MALSVRSLAPSPAPTREQITRRCAQLLAQRNDLDPTGAAYEACSMQLDNTLSALWALGPPDHQEGDPA